MKKYLFYFSFFYRNLGSFLFTSRKLLFVCGLLSHFFYSQEVSIDKQSVITVYKGATIVSVDGGTLHVIEGNDGISEAKAVALQDASYDEPVHEKKKSHNTKPKKITKAIPDAKKSSKKVYKKNRPAGECFLYSTTSREFFSAIAGTSYNAVNTSYNNLLTLYAERGDVFTPKVPALGFLNNYYFISAAYQQSFYKRWSVRPPPCTSCV